MFERAIHSATRQARDDGHGRAERRGVEAEGQVFLRPVRVVGQGEVSPLVAT